MFTQSSGTDHNQTNASKAAPGAKASPKRRRLGKGLSGLIGEPASVSSGQPDIKIDNKANIRYQDLESEHDSRRVADDTEELDQSDTTISTDQNMTKSGFGVEDRVVHLPLASVIPNRFQPRADFEAEGLAELAASIRSEGIMQPVLVRPASGGGATGGRYELIAGERRWRAAKLAGLKRVPAIVRELSDASSAEWALIENVHRQDLNAMERAEAMASLLSRFGMSQTALAEKLGLERPTVANLVRLVELEPAIRDLIAAGKLGAGHGKALLALPESQERLGLASQAAEEGWSVRRLENEVRTSRDATPPPNKGQPSLSQRQAVHEALERRLSDHLGTKVRIKAGGGGLKGKIEIAFFDLDHFDGLVRSLGIAESEA